MAVDFPDLPYEMDALEPHVSARTLEFHYGKHHRAYVDKLNAAIVDTAYDGQSLERIIAASHEASDTGIFNNAAQAWNHDFLWHSMSPEGGGEPGAELGAALRDRFGDLDAFRAEFRAAALGRFGSGWTWLVRTDTGLEITSTGNADTPLTAGVSPLLTLDVWEHAYYLDYQNRRNAYVDDFLSNLANWDFATANLTAATA